MRKALQLSVLKRLPLMTASPLAAIFLVATPALAQSYGVTALQDLTGQGGVAIGINAAGSKVGISYTNGGGIPVEWSRNGKPTALPDVGGVGYSSAIAINARGYVVGYADTQPVNNRNGAVAVEWSPNGTATVLQDVGGVGYSIAQGINDAGYVVGYSAIGSSPYLESVEWAPDGTPTVLPHVGGVGDSEAYGINDAGYVVGVSEHNSVGTQTAVEWAPDGTPTALKDVGGVGDSFALAINAAGDIVGWSGTGSGTMEAVEWSRTGEATALPEIGIVNEAYGINAAGDIVGWAETSTGYEAVLWPRHGTPIVLPDFEGAENSFAHGINAAGDIVGSAYLAPVEWSRTAVPEPSTYVMMLAGFSGIGLATLFHKRKSDPSAT
jgi:uncharacterized membrane protein